MIATVGMDTSGNFVIVIGPPLQQMALTAEQAKTIRAHLCLHLGNPTDEEMAEVLGE